MKFKSLGVRQGENSDVDTYKEVEKYEKIIIEYFKKNMTNNFNQSLIWFEIQSFVFSIQNGEKWQKVKWFATLDITFSHLTFHKTAVNCKIV